AYETAEVGGLSDQVHGARFGFSDVHDRADHGEDALGFFEAIGEGFAGGGGIGVLESQFGGAAQTSQRGAQIMGDVVHGFAHGANEGLVFVQHGVEEEGEFVEFVAVGPGGNAGVEVAGLDDVARGGDDLADGQDGAMGEEAADDKAKERDG